MSNTLKKVWITPKDVLVSLSLESKTVWPEYLRLHTHESLFPDNPTPGNPRRHVTVISNLTMEDIVKLHTTLSLFLENTPSTTISQKKDAMDGRR